MSKVKIKLVSIGQLPTHFNIKKIKSWKSSAFEIVDNIDNYAFRCDSDGSDWEFSDRLVKNQLPATFDADFLIAIVNVPLEANWYSRRLGHNRVVFTYHQIKEILAADSIPLENIIFGYCMPTRCYTNVPETKFQISGKLLALLMTKPEAAYSI